MIDKLGKEKLEIERGGQLAGVGWLDESKRLEELLQAVTHNQPC